MKKVLILGGTGLLGMAVKEVLSKVPDLKVFATDSSIYRVTQSGSITSFIGEKIEWADYVINCIGVINKHMEDDIPMAIKVNSIFPWEIARKCNSSNSKLIHITTDCVFSGDMGNYDESSLHDAEDLYGKSKSLGEPNNCMVIRTSIIGRERDGSHFSFVGWLCSQRGKSINGFINHYWNGVTTKTYADICLQIIQNKLYQEGVFHVFSPNDMSKFDMARLVNDALDLGLKIDRFEAPQFCDRTLRTTNDLCSTLSIPSLESQIYSM